MKNKLNWLEALLVIAPFLILIAFWNQIPQRVPLHWNVDGQIDRWGSKSSSMFMLPLISLATIALLHFVPWLDPKLRRQLNWADRMDTVLPIFRILFAAFFLVVFLVVFGATIGISISVGRILVSSILLLLAGIGNYLGNLKPNYFVGIRTPWTLESPATWRATHRLGGRILFFGSTALLVAEFFVPERVFVVLLTAGALLLVVWSFVYSWHHFRTCSAADRTSSST
jgi:uncharacterized membrane protein